MKNFDLSFLTDPKIFWVNALPAHSDFHPQSDENNSQISLNGSWWFNYSHNPDCVNWDFIKEDFDCTGFNRIKVPAQIQLEGYDTPQYVNRMYPWDGIEEINYPNIPKRFNPVGQYAKYIDLETPAKRTFISFQGVETAYALWVNGKFVGYKEDSYTPADFELTDFLHTGRNKLAVAVFKFSTGSWLEDQDFWRMSGIMRDVYLYTTPKERVRDFYFSSNVDIKSASATANLSVWCENITKEHSLSYKLCDKKGNEIASKKFSIPENGEIKESISLTELSLWSAEAPTLYTLILELSCKEEILQNIHYNVGFKRSEIVDGVWYINGKRLVLNGVNRHDSSHVNGRSVTKEEMLWDIVQMKRHNINAVRTSHYPNHPYLYQLCNEYGIYVMDETNLETHGTWKYGENSLAFSLPGNNKDWRDIVVARTHSMFQRDKNLACVISWSLGNESYGGENFRAMKQAVRDYDKITPVHYEGVWHCKDYADVTDITSSMYTRAALVAKDMASRKDKPFILCEFSHAMGNSCGGLHKYIELTEQFEQYQGGFIWDFIDQGLLTKDCYGKEYLGFGGDFGDRPNDTNFCINGLVFGDRRLSPKMQLVKTCYQNAKILPTETSVTITNKNLFTNLSDYDGRYTVAKNGVAIETGEITFDMAPLETKTFDLPVKKHTDEGEFTVTVSLHLKEDSLWEKKGYEVLFGQFVYANEKTKKAEPKGNLRIENSETNLGVYGDNFSCIFARNMGGITSYRVGEKELVTTIPKPNFWRAPTDNDRGNGSDFDLATWKTAGLYCKTGDFECGEQDGGVWVEYCYKLPTTPATTCFVRYTVLKDSSMSVSLRYIGVEGLPKMPEFSYMLGCNKDFSNISWYGYGPDDNYQDTVQGARLGIFNSTALESLKPYVIPQESGNKAGVRWLEVTNAENCGIRIECETPLEISALPYNPHQLEAFDHPNKLPDVYETVLRISEAKMGVGGDDSWGAPVLSEYCLPSNKDRSFSFVIRPII